jgi:hypothetical protein
MDHLQQEGPLMRAHDYLETLDVAKLRWEPISIYIYIHTNIPNVWRQIEVLLLQGLPTSREFAVWDP